MLNILWHVIQNRGFYTEKHALGNSLYYKGNETIQIVISKAV